MPRQDAYGIDNMLNRLEITQPAIDINLVQVLQ
jgi:hypothetical protein